MDPEQSRDGQVEQANALYWESGESVNRIAEALNVSKGALYGMILPHPVGLDCPCCGAGFEYPNRTARERGSIACGGCGFEEDEQVLREASDELASRGAGAVGAQERADASDANGSGPVAFASAVRRMRWLQTIASRERALVGSALLGVAAGILIGSLLGRSR